MKTWTMRDGTEVKIKHMGDTHLVNSLRMMRRNASKAIERVTEQMINLSCGVSGEEASYQLDRDIAEMGAFSEDPDEFLERNPQYLALLKEYKKRKLSSDLGEVV